MFCVPIRGQPHQNQSAALGFAAPGAVIRRPRQQLSQCIQEGQTLPSSMSIAMSETLNRPKIPDTQKIPTIPGSHIPRD